MLEAEQGIEDYGHWASLGRKSAELQTLLDALKAEPAPDVLWWKRSSRGVIVNHDSVSENERALSQLFKPRTTTMKVSYVLHDVAARILLIRKFSRGGRLEAQRYSDAVVL